MPTHEETYPGIPADFPIGSHPSALAGAQPKLVVVLAADGNFYAPGTTPEQVRADYENCIDLQQQMVSYCQRKIAAAPGSEADILTVAFKKFLFKEYCSTPEQARWMFDRLAAELGWTRLESQ